MRLEDYKNKQPFSTPDGYFEELNRKIIEVTSNAPTASATPEKKSIRLGVFAKWLSIAAMLALVCLIAFNGIYRERDGGITTPAGGIESTLADGTGLITDDEFIESLLDNYPIDDYTFYCYLTEYE